MTAPILSGSIFSFSIRGAYGLSVSRGAGKILSIWSRINARPALLCSIAWRSTATGKPCTFMSICSAVMPLAVPVTLKSISPAKSSASAMSLSTYGVSPSIIRPMAMPETGAFNGTPASISAKQLEQVAAIDVEPFWLIISVTERMAYGKSSSLGSTGVKARSAK